MITVTFKVIVEDTVAAADIMEGFHMLAVNHPEHSIFSLGGTERPASPDECREAEGFFGKR